MSKRKDNESVDLLQNLDGDSTEPQSSKFAYFVFVMFGIGSLLSWNAVLTALDFFIDRLQTNAFQPGFHFGLLMNAPNFFFTVLSVFLAQKIPLKLRLVGGFFTVFVMTLILPFVAQYTNNNRKVADALCSIIIIIMGIANAFAQGGAFGYAAIYPPAMMGALMFGQGFSGTVCNIVRMICLAILPPNQDAKEDMNAYYGCLIYFSIAALILIACIVLFYSLQNTSYAKFYIRKASKAQHTERKSIISRHSSLSDSLEIVRVNQSADPTELSSDRVDEAPQTPQNFMFIYKKVFPLSSQVFLCFLITFIVFPGVCLETKFKFLDGKSGEFAWNSVLMITFFNTFDTIGRFLGGSYQLFTPNTVIILTLVRLIFVFTFIMIGLNKLFQSDWFRIVNMALFAFTNGYNSTLLMIYGPTGVQNEHKERAGIIMSFHLVGGIFAGSLVAIGMGKINFPEVVF